jgi:hypothetical protein
MGDSEALITTLASGAKKLGDSVQPQQLEAVSKVTPHRLHAWIGSNTSPRIQMKQFVMEGNCCKNTLQAMRTGGAAGALIAIMSPSGGAPPPSRAEAAQVAAYMAQQDFSFAELLFRAGGIVKVVASEPDSFVLLNVMLVVIRGLTRGAREKLYDELFSSGALPKLCHFLESPELNDGEGV